ncbi:hypothetical protein N8977_04850 [Alphaproteobacteria bacterium]|nr:hypothetical protein [Alphaproteobacteria bacterium]
MDILILICGRAGSERLPDKNIRPFRGSSLIEIACNQGGRVANKMSELGHACKVVLSSDLNVQTVRGVEYVWRPARLANSTASLADVVLHAVKSIGLPDCIVCLLQPTSPIRKDIDIVQGIESVIADDAVTVISVSKPLQALQDIICLDGSLITTSSNEKIENSLFINGCFYVFKSSVLKGRNTIVSDSSPVIWQYTDAVCGIDIDYQFQFDLAEKMYDEKFCFG